jgi:hypothetical protein
MSYLSNLSPETRERLRQVYTRREAEKAKLIQERKGLPHQTNTPAPEVKPDVQTQFVPITFKTAFLFEGLFGKDFLDEFNARAKRDYDDATVLKVLSYVTSSNRVTGSNVPSVVLANQILKPMKIRTATQAELEQILNQNTLVFKGHYEESSLVWRSDENPNEYFAQNISDQLRKHIALNPNSAYVIPLHACSLRQDVGSPNGLAYIINNPELVFEAPILMRKNGSYLYSGNMNVLTGLPNEVYDFDLNGKDRRIFTHNSGLLRLGLGRNLDVISYDDNLDLSISDGQVVCVSEQVSAPKKFKVAI